MTPAADPTQFIHWPDDLFTLARTFRNSLVQLNYTYFLGIRVDHFFHFVVAAILFLALARWLSRSWAFFVTFVAIILKELADLPRQHTPDAIPLLGNGSPGDILCGLAGAGVAYLIVLRLGQRWRPRGLGRLAPPPHAPLLEIPIGRAPAWIFAAFAVTSITALAVALELGSGFNWIHLLGVLAACIAAWLLGPAWTLVGILPLVPFINWLDLIIGGPVGQPAHPLASSDPLILGLGAFAAAALLRPRKNAPSQPYEPGSPRFRLTLPDLLILAFAALSILTVTASCIQNGPSTLRVRWIVAAFEVAIIYLIVTRTFARRHLLAAVAGIAAGLIIMSVWGIIEFFTTRPFALQVIPQVTYPSAEWFSMYLVMAIPFLAAFAFLARSRLRWLAAAAALLGFICVGLVFSRACWVGVGIALPLIAVIWAARTDWFLGIAALCALALALFLGYRTLQTVRAEAHFAEQFNKTRSLSPFLSEISSIVQPGALNSTRGHTFATSRSAIAAHPFVGAPGQWVGNYYLNLAVTYGVPLAILLLLAVTWLLGSGSINAWSLRDRHLFALVAAALIGIVGAALEGVAESGYSRPGFIPLFWFLLAAIPAAIAAERRQFLAPTPKEKLPPAIVFPERETEPDKRSFLFISLICIAVICIILYLISR